MVGCIYCAIQESEFRQIKHEDSDTEDEKTDGTKKISSISNALNKYRDENRDSFNIVLNEKDMKSLISMMKVNSSEITNNLDQYMQLIHKTSVLYHTNLLYQVAKSRLITALKYSHNHEILKKLKLSNSQTYKYIGSNNLTHYCLKLFSCQILRSSLR